MKENFFRCTVGLLEKVFIKQAIVAAYFFQSIIILRNKTANRFAFVKQGDDSEKKSTLFRWKMIIIHDQWPSCMLITQPDAFPSAEKKTCLAAWTKGKIRKTQLHAIFWALKTLFLYYVLHHLLSIPRT